MVFLPQGGVVSGGAACLWLTFILETEVYLDLATEARAHSRMGVGLWPPKLGGIGSLQRFLLSPKDRDLLEGNCSSQINLLYLGPFFCASIQVV